METPCDSGEGLHWRRRAHPSRGHVAETPSFLVLGWQGATIKICVLQGHSNCLKPFQSTSVSHSMSTSSIWLALSNIFV